MNNRLKYTLILVSTLIIGMAIGFLINGRVTSTRIEKIRGYYSEGRFNRELVKIIQPTPEQSDKVSSILKEYSNKNCEMMEGFRSNQKQMFTDMRAELDKILNPEQVKRINNYWERRKHRDNRSHEKRLSTRKHRNRE